MYIQLYAILKYCTLANAHERTKKARREDGRCVYEVNLGEWIELERQENRGSHRRELEFKKVGKTVNGAVEGRCIQLSVGRKMCVKPKDDWRKE